ncbi:uncharacterized protein VTP21DRAFT_6686 [Calcarisporiella thermophila]|uniref:uncharacterized protein n=1 Tax=Calcarisporiella thermophila TaxID=911321 RepID=UPI003744B124
MFSFDDIPDQTGRVIVITGANTGLGLVCAQELAKKNAHVILACRSKEKTQPVVDQIKSTTGNQNVEYMQLDLLSLASVNAFVAAFKNRGLPLHVLIANAGIMYAPFTLSEDGIESQFATNHVGHHMLVVGLLPVIEKSAPARIVVVSSLAHRLLLSGGLALENISNPKYYNFHFAYARSKLANILMVRELNRQLEERGVKDVWCNSVHPGAVKTELQRFIPRIMSAVAGWFLISPEQGALTQLYAATSPQIVEKNYRARYFTPIAKLSEPTCDAQNDALAKQLWDFTEQLINEKIPNRA